MAERYVFTIHTKVKWAIIPGASFIVCYCPSDAMAIQLADYLEANVLPNNAKITVSKTIRMAATSELPDPADLSDVSVQRWLMGSTLAPDGRFTFTFQAKPDFDAEALANELFTTTCDINSNMLNRVFSQTASLKNVVSGGPAA